MAAGLSFPAGAGGVPTMRVVCEYAAPAVGSLADGRPVSFADSSYPDRIGWREIVVLGDGVTIAGSDGAAAPSTTDISTRLSSYPKDLLTQPLNVRSATFTVGSGGSALPPFVATDAEALAGTGPAPGGNSGAPTASAKGSAAIAAAVVPGGVGGDIPDLFRVADLTPLLGVVSILLAMALGAGHALTSIAGAIPPSSRPGGSSSRC